MAAVDELLIPLRPPGGIHRESILQALNYRAADIMGVTIGIVQINVTDLDRAKRFYGDILGHEITGGRSGAATIRGDGGPLLLLYPVKNIAPVDYPNQTGTTIVFYVDDIEGTVAKWRDQGVEFIPIAWSTDASGIAACPFGRFIAFRDPFGNVHEILQPAE